MGIYGNDEYLTEGFFLSSEGKSKKNKIKEICKSTKEKMSFKKAFTTKWDEEIEKKTFEQIKNEFSHIHIGPVIENTTTSSNGVTSVEYYREVVGTSGNFIYIMKIILAYNQCRLQLFTEIGMDKLKYQKDVVEYVVDNCNSHYVPLFSKNRIEFNTYSYDKYRKGYVNPNIDKVSKYIKSKYPDLSIVEKSDKIVFK